MDRGDWLAAEDLLNQAVEVSPLDPDARRRDAETLWHRGAARQAISQLEEAARLAAEDPQIAVRTGEMYLATGQMARARKEADRALDLDPKLAAAWALRGQTNEATGALKPALADYQRSLGYQPDNRQVLLAVAEIYRQLNEPERALVSLHSLVDSYPPGEEPQQLLYLEGLALVALRPLRRCRGPLRLGRRARRADRRNPVSSGRGRIPGGPRCSGPHRRQAGPGARSQSCRRQGLGQSAGGRPVACRPAEALAAREGLGQLPLVREPSHWRVQRTADRHACEAQIQRQPQGRHNRTTGCCGQVSLVGQNRPFGRVRWPIDPDNWSCSV